LIHEADQRALCLLFNAGNLELDFHLPSPPPTACWRLAVDTFAEAPHDLFPAGEELPLKYPKSYLVKPRSSVILIVPKPGGANGGDVK